MIDPWSTAFEIEGIEYRSMVSADEQRVTSFYQELLSHGGQVKTFVEWARGCDSGDQRARLYLALAKRDVVGVINAVPLQIRHKATAISACWQQNTLISPAMRGKGIGKRLVDLSAEGFDLILAKGTSKAMYGLRKSLGFLDVPHSNYLIRVLAPFANYSGLKKRLAFPSLFLLSKLRTVAKIKTRLRISRIEEFDRSFDILAHRLSEDCMLRPFKDRAYLNQRYSKCPGRQYIALRADDSKGLRGALLLSLNRTPGTTAWLVDAICAPKDSDCALGLFDAAIELLKSSKASDIWAFCTSPESRRWLYSKGFIGIPATPRFTYRLQNPSLRINPIRIQWDFWHGDGDVELYT